MSNIKNVIRKHDQKIMKNLKQTTMKIWSCIQKSDFPLDVNHLSEFLVYNAVVNTSATKNYYGTCKKKVL